MAPSKPDRWLSSARIISIYDGTHEWKVWRRCLRDFAQMLFCD